MTRRLVAALCATWLAVPTASPRAAVQPAAEVYAVRFATVSDFPVRSLVRGADPDRRLDIAMALWVIRQPDGRVVLVDAGFHRAKFLDQWAPVDYLRPDRAIESALGITASVVSDVILTHVHWDHADGADLFPNARVWLQQEEYDHHVDADGAAIDRAVDPEVAAMLASLRRTGRVTLIEGDDQPVLPGIRAYTGGRHTYASQYVGVTTRAGVVVLASDNAYLYENLEQRVAIAQTLDAEANLAAQARMLALAARSGLVVPGHDPAVFSRFPAAGPRAVRID